MHRVGYYSHKTVHYLCIIAAFIIDTATVHATQILHINEIKLTGTDRMTTEQQLLACAASDLYMSYGYDRTVHQWRTEGWRFGGFKPPPPEIPKF
jgi:hypothetical protein